MKTIGSIASNYRVLLGTTNRPDPFAHMAPRDGNVNQYVERIVKLIGWQREFVNDRNNITFAVGGLGSGKTYALDTYVVAKMFRERGTGMIGGIFANSYTQLSHSTLPTLWKLLEEDIGFEYGTHYVYNERPPRFWSGFRDPFKKKHNGVLSIRPWGQAVTRSLENYDLIRGITLGWAALDELRDTRKEAYDVVWGRLRSWEHVELRAVTTPNGFDWIYEEIVEKADSNPAVSKRLIQMTTRDNVFTGDQYAARLESQYDSRLAQQEVGGKFVSITSGMVFWPFDRAKHVADIAYQPGSFDVTFDFNRTPFSTLIAQVQPDGREGYVDEVVMNDTDTGPVCDEIIRRISPYAGRNDDQTTTVRGLVNIYGDPAGSSKSTKSNQSDYDIIVSKFRAAFGDRVMRCWQRAHNTQVHGVSCVNAQLERDRIVISRRCKELRKDLERVKWKEGSRQIDKTEDPQRTHTSDAMRYHIEIKHPIRRSAGGAPNLFI